MEHKDILNKIIKFTIPLSALGIGGYAVFRPLEIIPFTLGILIGTAGSALRILILIRAMEKISNNNNPQKAKLIMQFNAIFRYFFMIAILLIIAFLHSYNVINFWGAIYSIGVFQIAIYLANYSINKK